MSIDDLISDRLARGMLHRLEPKLSGTPAWRAMFVSEGIWRVLSTEHGDDEMEERLGILQADLELFVEGQPVDPRYLFLLYPPGEAVWEIRSARPAPSIRVLGRFARKDVFVATNMALREDLGGWQSRAWKDVKRRACAEWNRLFHPYPPMLSTNIHDLVTGAIDGKYFKA